MNKRLNLIVTLTICFIFYFFLIELTAQSYWWTPEIIHADCDMDNGRVIYDDFTGDFYEFEWSTGDTLSQLENLSPGTYYLTLTGTLVYLDTIEIKRSDAPKVVVEEIDVDGFKGNLCAKIDNEHFIMGYEVGDSVEIRLQPMPLDSPDSLLFKMEYKLQRFFQYSQSENSIFLIDYLNSVVLQKRDLAGNVIWSSDINSAITPGDIVNFKVSEDAIYFISNTEEPIAANDNPDNPRNGKLTKYDLNGNYLWTNIYGGTKDDFFYDLELLNNNIFISGNSYSDDIDLENDLNETLRTWLLELDTDGNIIKSKRYNSARTGNISELIELPNGRRFLASVGNMDNLGAFEVTGAHCWIAEVDNNFDVMKIEALSREYGDRFFNVTDIFTYRDGLIVVSSGRARGLKDIGILSYVDANLNLRWEKHIPFCGEGTSVYVLDDDKIVVTGGSCYQDYFQVGIFPSHNKGFIQLEPRAQFPYFEFDDQRIICDSTHYAVDILGEDMSFLWNTGDTIAQVVFEEVGDYAVTVTNGDGCIFLDSFNLDFIENPIELDLGNDITQCNILNIDADNEGMQYYWQDFSTNQTFQIGESETVFVRVISEEGCTASDTMVFNFISTFDNQAEILPSPCNDEPLGQINLLNNTNPSLFAYEWSDGTLESSASDLLEGWHFLTVTDLTTNCQAIDTFLLIDIVNQSLKLEIEEKNIDCFGGEELITAIASGGQAPYTYNWNDVVADSMASLPAGIHFFTVTDIYGCELTTPYTLTETSEITIANIDIGHPTGNNNNGYIHFEIQGGHPIPIAQLEIYQLFINGEQSSLSIPSFNNLSAGTYEIAIRDLLGCEKLFTFDLTTNATKETTLPSQAITLSPNPTSNTTFIRINEQDLIISQIVLFNQVGQRQLFEFDALTNELVMNELPSGVYFVSIKTNQGVVVKKLMKL